MKNKTIEALLEAIADGQSDKVLIKFRFIVLFRIANCRVTACRDRVQALRLDRQMVSAPMVS